MIIQTRKDRPLIIVILIIILLGLGILIKHLSTDTPLDSFWMIVLVLFIYETCIIILDLYLSIFKSPLWIELNNKTLTIKMLFRKPYFINSDKVDSVKRRQFFPIGAYHNCKLNFIDKENSLFFRKDKLERLNELLIELKKVNPSCQIDESLM